jgi:hypothetical protein
MALTMASAQPGHMQVINLDGHRNSKFTCADTKNSNRLRCTATSPTRGPNKCLILCPTGKTCCKFLTDVGLHIDTHFIGNHNPP